MWEQIFTQELHYRLEDIDKLTITEFFMILCNREEEKGSTHGQVIESLNLWNKMTPDEKLEEAARNV